MCVTIELTSITIIVEYYAECIQRKDLNLLHMFWNGIHRDLFDANSNNLVGHNCYAPFVDNYIYTDSFYCINCL